MPCLGVLRGDVRVEERVRRRRFWGFNVQLGRLASVWGAIYLVLPDFVEAHSIPGELTAPRVSRG
jgi:hypothetical protein